MTREREAVRNTFSDHDWLVYLDLTGFGYEVPQPALRAIPPEGPIADVVSHVRDRAIKHAFAVTGDSARYLLQGSADAVGIFLDDQLLEQAYDTLMGS